jgi:hypothetical protein
MDAILCQLHYLKCYSWVSCLLFICRVCD